MTLRVGILAPVRRLDPIDSGDLVTQLVVRQIFETPMRLPTEPGLAEPALFAGPLSPEDDKASIFSALPRPGVFFSNGRALDAETLVASLRRVPTLRRQAQVEVDQGRVVFKLHEPNPRFDLTLTTVDFGVCLEQDGQLFGTGSFLGRITRAGGVELTCNPLARLQPRIKTILFKVYPPGPDGHPTALLEALRQGEIDFTNMLPKQDVVQVQGLKKRFQPSASVALLFFNTERAWLDQAQNRRAIAFGIDRTTLTSLCHGNVVAFRASSMLPPSLGQHLDGFEHDPVRARALLAASGLPQRTLELLVVWTPRPYLPYPQLVAEGVAKQLSAIGIKTRLTFPRDASEYFDKQKSGDFDLILGGWIIDFPDPSELFTALLAAERIPSPEAQGSLTGNLSRFKSAEAESALKIMRLEDQPRGRTQLLELVTREVPFFPLMYGATAVVHSWKLRGLELDPFGLCSFATCSLDEAALEG